MELPKCDHRTEGDRIDDHNDQGELPVDHKQSGKHADDGREALCEIVRKAGARHPGSHSHH